MTPLTNQYRAPHPVPEVVMLLLQSFRALATLQPSLSLTNVPIIAFPRAGEQPRTSCECGAQQQRAESLRAAACNAGVTTAAGGV